MQTTKAFGRVLLMFAAEVSVSKHSRRKLKIAQYR